MNTKDDGGPAFPNPGHDNGPGNYRGHPVSGLSLRDYFAAKAMAEILSWDSIAKDDWDDVSKLAYRQADSMLKARSL